MSAEDIAVIKRDYRNFYLERDNLIGLAAGITGAGISANTKMDGDIQKFYQDSIRSGTTNSISRIVKLPGDGFITIPVLLATHAFLRERPAGEWSQRSIRAIIVGTPTALLLQKATGASRPLQGNSNWRPFRSVNGLSGHAFIGAVPFITAARMSDNFYVKGLFYSLSILPGVSRINDNKHYFSQAALGWYLAFLSCNAVDKTAHKKQNKFLIAPLLDKGGAVFVSHTF